jgi:hypothetical protein
MRASVIDATANPAEDSCPEGKEPS